jgi:DNA-binding response OmpR family regulator
MEKPKLLLVDDDLALADVISEGLAKSFEVITTSDVDIAFRVALQNQPDGILLDIHIKDQNGIELCNKLRSNLVTKRIPILIMTGHGSREKMLSSYDVGADDYVEKPIDIGVLENRLLSRLKRVGDLSIKPKAIGNLKIFPERSEVELNGRTHHLSQTELSLLRLLLSNINRNVTREEILKSLWTDATVGERTIDVHISSLRRKLKDFDHQIESLYGSGYILRPQNIESRSRS